MINLGKPSGIEFVIEFEKLIAEFLDVNYVIAVSSGTMADTIALAVLKHKFPNKNKVIVPALTFIAQVNSIIYNNLEPQFIDFGGDIESGEDILCFFPVHLLGKPAKWSCDIPVIEDACEAFGSKLNGKFCGTIGDMGTFSFYNTHSLSIGEGGAIVTDNKEYADIARQLRNQGSNGEGSLDKFHFDMVGFNGRMAGSQAKLGIEEMNKVSKILKKRHDNFLYLGGKERPGEYTVPHGFPMFYDNRDGKMRELISKGIDCRKLFSCIPTREKPYFKYAGSFPLAEKVGDRGLYVPCHENLSKEELDLIKENL